MFSQRLKELRKQSGYSRTYIAQNLGLSVSSISNYENNIRKPDNDEIWRKLASIFDVSVDYLMGEDIEKLSFEERKKLVDRGLVLKKYISDKPQILAADTASLDGKPIIIASNTVDKTQQHRNALADKIRNSDYTDEQLDKIEKMIDLIT